MTLLKSGATTGIRTQDLILTMDALYQLSYRGIASLSRRRKNCSSSWLLTQAREELAGCRDDSGAEHERKQRVTDGDAAKL